MTGRIQTALTTAAVLVAVIAGGAVIANAASGGGGDQGSTASSGTTGQQGGPRQGEEPLTGETAERVRAAALAEIPNGTVLRVETDAGGSAYEAHVRRADGTEVVVLVNEQFEVTDVQELGPRGGGPGGRGPGDRPCDRDRGDGSRGNGSGSGSSESAFPGPPVPGGEV